ncbi:MAG: RHS repeat domain-containing protein, partial [Stenotrophomonas sp.]
MLLFLVVFCVDAAAQGTFNLHENTIERISQARDVSPLSVDTVFGDQVSHYDGSASFNHVDITMPGSDALPVELRRTLRVEDRLRTNGHFLGGFGEWALDVPRLSSEIATSLGWRPSSGTVNQRCSLPGPLPDVGTISAEDYWGGYSLHIPGAGGQQLLMNPSSSIPAAGGGPYPWITKDMWRIACKASTKNGYAGEAFMALSPQGVKYHLDWAVSKAHAGINQKLDTGGINRQVIHFLVSRVEDRFGNWVDYTYSGDKLTGITASDGRQITLTWSGSNVASATSSVGNWAYTYASGKLSQVTRPDGSKWTFTSTGALTITPAPWSPLIEDPTGCPDSLEAPTGTYTLSITAPSGAVGQFNFNVLQHWRSSIPEHACQIVSPTYWFMKTPRFHWNLSLLSRTITGPGLPTMSWSYTYGAPNPLFSPDSKQNTMAGPDSTWVRYTYGTGYNLNEGQMLAVEEGSSAANILQTRTDTYLTTAEAASQHFPSAVGSTPRMWSDLLATEWLRPLRQSVTTRQGISFTRQTPNTCLGKYCFDVFARPTVAIRSSTLPGSPSRTEQTDYHDNTGKWVLGQIAQVKCTAPTTALPAGCGASGTVVSSTSFDATWALPLVHQQFGRTLQTLTWNTTASIASGQLGTVATVKDGNNHTTTVSSWKRGIPQSIQYPATAESPSGATQSATVNNAGWITSATDENGYKTCYAHDAMGRISQVTYPSEATAGVCDTSTWAATTQQFVQVTSAEYGIPAGHWRQTVATGNGRKVAYFDGLWRPLLVREYDTANESGTQRFSRSTYNHRGQPTFAAYPATVHNASAGTTTTYDALGRPTSAVQDSELSPAALATTTEYLTGFQTRVTDPKGNQTTTSYRAWDQPTFDFPVLIAHPASTWTHITRDVFGKPTQLRRSNTSSPGGGTGVDRNYTYNTHQQLCRSVEPETGATLLGYDGAGNVKWSAAG